MKLIRTGKFKQGYKKLPQPIKNQTKKQLKLFLANHKHPSLRTKKMSGFSDIWECRITRDYRFTFQIAGDTYILRRIGKHDILKTPS